MGLSNTESWANLTITSVATERLKSELPCWTNTALRENCVHGDIDVRN